MLLPSQLASLLISLMLIWERYRRSKPILVLYGKFESRSFNLG
jgi:hypothetical protein